MSIIFMLQMSHTVFARVCSPLSTSCITIPTHIRVVYTLYCIVFYHCVATPHQGSCGLFAD